MDKQLRFSRLEKVIGEDNVSLINNKSVLILGVGGVGGYVAEALARSNIGKLILVDFDVVDESNINRQIIALESTIGMKKVDVLEKRIKEINSGCEVIKIDRFIDLDNYLELFEYNIDYFVDACDTMTVKKAVIKECIKRKINFISSMGTGNKLDPSKLEIVDIRKTVNDPLAKVIRKFVKDEKINGKVMVLSSTELPVKTGERTPGSTAFVPASAGLLIASYVVRQFIKK
ncbi:MAG: tRNA threonylcarbamoyladenosine dehydratase [Bacilli bacterium]|nr:tRNA threonylcarbamoyladenosine dehydratase [Bacilli bacterium]